MEPNHHHTLTRLRSGWPSETLAVYIISLSKQPPGPHSDGGREKEGN